MKRNGHLVLAVLAFACNLTAASPALTGVVNPASNIPPGLPNYGIAQGSIFVIYGSGLGPATLTQVSALPLPTTAGLAGTTVSVTVNGTTLPAPLIYTYQSQVAAILPSTIPIGSGTVAVSYNGVTGTSPLVVVASNLGISTVNQSGTGAGVVTFPNYSLVTSSASAKPGDTLVIWGTGLGAISGSDAIVPISVDLGTPIQVYVGGVQASVLYRGRSASPGLDQVNIIVPQGVTPGCGVSLVVQTGSLVSNTVSIPVAPGGGTCSDPTFTSTTPTIPTGAATYKYGLISLESRSQTLTTNNQTATTNSAAGYALFDQVTITQPAGTGTTSTGSGTTSTASYGSCSVVSTLVSLTGTGGGTGGGTGTGSSGVTTKPLDAGTSLSATPPAGSVISFGLQSPGSYAASVANIASLPAGAWQISNGTGGADIGPFTLNFNLSPPLVWTNQSAAMTTIDRTKPFTMTWTGGDPLGSASIILSTESLNLATSSFALAEVSCSAPVSAGQFTIPPYVLLGLIPGALTNLVELSGGGGQAVTIPGLDYAYLSYSSATVVGTSATTFK